MRGAMPTAPVAEDLVAVVKMRENISVGFKDQVIRQANGRVLLS